MKFVLLKDVSDEEAAVIAPLLEAHGIHAELRYSGLAAPSRVFMGRSIFGNNICVPEDQLEEAKKLLEELSEEIPPEELEAQALAAGGESEPLAEYKSAPESLDSADSADYDWKIADYGLDK